jgi:ankyrin repeat protein
MKASEGEFQSLVRAILADDRGRVRWLLKQNPELSGMGAAQARFESTIAHWIYAGDTALHVAAAGHRVEIAKLLLDSGAEVNAARNHRRGQPLHYAADGFLENPNWNAARQVRTIEALLKGGADVHAQDKNGATPLHRAVRTRCAAAVEELLESGADVQLRNKTGSTTFHLAVQNTGRGGSGSETAKHAQREIIRAFLARGISPRLKDANGRTVLDWAKSDWIRSLLVSRQ